MGESKESIIPEEESIGFIGAGNMAQAIAFRMLDLGLVSPSNMIVSAPSDRNLQLWKSRNVATTNDNGDVVKKATVVFIAVKPQYFASAALQFNSLTNTAVKCFVSVMAGKTIRSIYETLHGYKHVQVIRVMPNTPCMVGIGCSVMCCSPSGPQPVSYPYDPKYRKMVFGIMSSLGICEEIPESLFNSVSGLCGSGPAYVHASNCP